jgi:hypothetical protein
MNITTTDLVNLGGIAAQAWDDCDIALKELNESFGKPYDCAKDNLLRDIKIAEQDNLDLSVFSGEQSRFKFRQYDTNIVVRVYRKPTPHAKLEKITEKITKLEEELKLLKLKLKHETEQLVLSKQCDNITDKIVLAFGRLK